MKLLFSIPSVLSVFALNAVAADKEQGWDPDTKFPPLPPAEAIKTIEVPKGYHLQCIASEPMVEEPASFAFDGNGAMYVCEWRTYMQNEEGTNQLEAVSRVVKLVDTDGDGVMDKRTVFIDNVILPRTVLPMQDRVLVNFTGSNSVFAYFDDNKDGVADRREVAFESGPNGGNIEHQNSGLLWNLDNTICSNDFRFRYAGGKLVPGKHSVGRISQWGLARDDDGRLFCTWAGGANPAHSFQLPAGYPILKLNEHADGYRVPYASCKVWDQSSGGYKTDEQRVLRDFSACCGQTVLRSHLMPEFYGRVVTCEPVGRLLRMSRIDWKDGLGVADNAFPKSEFIRSTDAYFRPVWSETAPDGTLVFSDLYRGIIQEKAWFPTKDTDNRKDWVARYHRVKKWGMVEVVRHGRIYRLVPDGKQPGPQPRMLDETPAQLVAHLAHPNGWWRDSAQKLLVSRGDKSVIPALTAMADSNADVNARIHAMWTLQGLDALPKQTVIAATKHESARVRRAAVQLAESLLVAKDADIAKTLASMLGDADAQVRTQLFLAYRAAGQDAPAELTAIRSPIINALISKEKADGLQGALTESAKQGRQIYETLCTTCHGPDGKGVKAGDKFLAPAFRDSDWFKNDGNTDILARIVLKGQSGPISGVSYGEGFMLALEAAYNDEQLASVLNFIGERWHAWKKPASAADIARVRKEIAERKTPWTHEELLALAKKGRPAKVEPPAAPGGTVVPVAALSGDFRPLDLSGAFTADTRKGLYSSEKAVKDSLPFVKFGRVLANGVPYEIADPAKSANGKNVIVLNGGPEKSVARTMPQRVEVAVGAKVARLHFLGGVAGWGGGPGANSPAMTATLHFAGGATQVADLRAGREFVDYIRRIDTPGSQFADGIVSEHQVRTFAIPVAHAATLEKVVLESPGSKIAPTTVAITAELGAPTATPAPAVPATPAPAPVTPAPKAPTETPAPAAPSPAKAALAPDDPKTTAATGQKFAEPKAANTLRVLLIGAGASHDFPRYFLGADSEILRAAGGIDTAATPNLEEALALLPQADVLVLSANHAQFGKPEFQQALKQFADAGKGVVVLHAGTWRNWAPASGFNQRFVGGGAKSHGHGDFTVTLKQTAHPILKGVPATFQIKDENYHAELDPAAAVEVLAENAPDKGSAHPSVWVVKDAKTRIACITLGHAAEAHGNPAFKTLLTNAVKWVGAR
ncbi:MAG: hypothetical protein RL088_169 [Verrucomicrobiota bacterium]|jgi:type 1 glutamine amidotransferase/mono/diheme cytochrome c family protein